LYSTRQSVPWSIRVRQQNKEDSATLTFYSGMVLHRAEGHTCTIGQNRSMRNEPSRSAGPPNLKNMNSLLSILLCIDTHMYGCCARRWCVVKIIYSKHMQRYSSETLKHHWQDERSQILAAVVCLITRTPLSIPHSSFYAWRLIISGTCLRLWHQHMRNTGLSLFANLAQLGIPLFLILSHLFCLSRHCNG